MQLSVHPGAALGHCGGHVDVVFVGALQTQLALPSLLGELLCNIGLLFCNRGQFNGQLAAQNMRHQQRAHSGGDKGDGAFDGVRVQIDHSDRLTGLDDLAVHGNQVALCLTVFVVQTPRHLFARDDGLAGGVRALHLGGVAAVRLLHCYQLVYAAEHGEDFINQLNLGQVLSCTELMRVWQNDLFQNGSKTDTTIKLSKEEIVWPVIVLALGKQLPSEYIEDYDQGFIDEITAQYSYIINTISEQYSLITKIIFDYNSSNCDLSMKERIRKFVANKWTDYISVFSFESLNKEVQEAVIKVILAKVIQQRYLIDNVSRGVSL